MTTTPVPLYRGDDWPFPLTWRQTDGTPINLTGFTPCAEVFLANAQTPVDITAAITGVNAAAGKFTVQVSADITKDAPEPSRFRYPYLTTVHVYVIDSLGSKRTLGVISVNVLSARA